MTGTGPTWPWQRKDARGWRLAVQAFHLLVGLLGAALAPAVAAGSLIGVIGGLIVFIIAGGHAALLGLPLAALGVWRGMVTALTSVLGGFIVGAVPSALFFWPFGWGSLESPFLDAGGLMEKGVPALGGWLIYAGVTAGFGACGAVGGVGFWFSWIWIRGEVRLDG